MRKNFSSVVIVAAGKGSRMNLDINKVFLELGNNKVINHTIMAFEKCEQVDEIIVVASKDDLEIMHEIVSKDNFKKLKKIVEGGITRMESVYNGLKQVSQDADIVAIHDGARPLIEQEEIINSINTANEVGACCVGVMVKDTVKIVENGFAIETPDRAKLWAVQTPQTFKKDIILKAHEYAQKNNIEATDDAMLVEKMGHPLKIVVGKYSNIKITTPEDIQIAKEFMKSRG